jgi:peptide/nickel transport system ATP-binding protein
MAEGAVAVAVPTLEVRDLVKHFVVRRTRSTDGVSLRGPRPVLHAVDGVSFALEAGRMMALVGESGCGKSTLARLIVGLLPATKGQVLLDGLERRAWSRRTKSSWTSAVQMVFQDPFSSLNPLHTVRYQLTRPLVNRGLGTRSEREARLAALLGTVQLTPPRQFLDKHPHELSGGQRQRIAIARALAVEPRVLVADEPVSMLDVSIRLGVLNLLAGLRESRQLAMLYITHDIASARYSADDVLVMYAGELVEGGSSEEVTQEPTHPYTKLLISAAPDPTRRGHTPAKLSTASELPNLINPPIRCRFASRCPHVMEVCKRRSPPRVDLGGHWVRCFLYGGEGDEASQGGGGSRRTRRLRAKGAGVTASHTTEHTQ